MKDLLSLARSLTWSPTEVFPISLKKTLGNLKRTEALSLLLTLTLVVNLLLGLLCSTLNKASLKRDPLVLKIP